eukprot:11280299-Alexandrium_andersonii.AAC.1
MMRFQSTTAGRHFEGLLALRPQGHLLGALLHLRLFALAPLDKVYLLEALFRAAAGDHRQPRGVVMLELLLVPQLHGPPLLDFEDS